MEMPFVIHVIIDKNCSMKVLLLLLTIYSPYENGIAIAVKFYCFTWLHTAGTSDKVMEEEKRVIGSEDSD